MRDDICTIPVSEGFEPKDGCPFCRMRSIAEKRVIDYIMGAAMMEPDVRIKTNELGFCKDHFALMQKAGNRLSLALTLDSHLTELEKSIFGKGKLSLFKPSAKKQAYKAVRVQESCFVCDKMNFGMEHMFATVYRVYEKEKSFRALFAEQPMFCLPHYAMMIDNIPANMDKKYAEEMKKTAESITKAYLQELSGDVRHFCEMFDYRNNTEDADWGNSKDSIERTISFLTGSYDGKDR